MAKKATTTSGQISRLSLTIAALSTVVEWYDFTLYLYFAVVLSRIFFGADGAALRTTLLSFAIAYLLRPLGAMVLGHLGDVYGRRRIMVLSMWLMALSMMATGLLPTRAAIGPLAGWLMLSLRCVMGFSVGGEYNAVIAYLLEGTQPERRGFVTSLASAASELGGLLAVGISAFVVNAMSPLALEVWGWRLPFLLGAALAAALGLARSKIEESPDFVQRQTAKTVSRAPLRDALRRHRQAIANGFAISAVGSMTYYVGITYVPAFLVATASASAGLALQLSTGAAVVTIAVTPAVGLLTDRLGRRPVLLAFCAAATVLPAPLFAVMAKGPLLATSLCAFVLAAVGAGVSAVGAVATAEQFPSAGRLSGLALGATTATALFGGLAPYASQRLLEATGQPLLPGIMISLVTLAALPWLWALPETHPGRALATREKRIV